MGTGYKVMAYQLKKTASSAKIQTVRVEDRQVDEAGELALWQEEDGQIRRSHRLTGVFHPRDEIQPRPQYTSVFHPQIVDGVAYIPGAEAVSTSQILEIAHLPGQGSAMSLIDEVINTVAKTEAHEVSFVDNPYIDPTKPSMRGVDHASRSGREENRKWLSEDTAEDILAQKDELSLDNKVPSLGSTLTLRSTQKAVIIPDSTAEPCSSAHLHAWVGGGMSAIAIPAVREEIRHNRMSGVEQLPVSTDKHTLEVPIPLGWSGQEFDLKRAERASVPTSETQTPEIPAVSQPHTLEPSLLAEAGIVTSANTIQRWTLLLLSVLVIVELLRLMLGK